ncbi:TPA: DUF1642 domain-containing protein [Streptococcus suis]
MNKQEAIRRMKREQFQVPYGPGIFVHAVFADKAIELISQIDEPQKVVVPKFVAEWIEEHEAQFSNLYTVYSWLGQQKNQVSEWVNSNIDIFARAWLFGYEVEQEQLYTVEIPNPHVSAYTVLQKQRDNIVLVGTPKNSGWRDWGVCQLTESEIKQDFEWAWDAGFAKEVE